MVSKTSPSHLLESIDRFRIEAGAKLDAPRRSELGQFMTPVPVASFMAGMFEGVDPDVRLLDAGAGVGSLSAACVQRLLEAERLPTRITVTAYEIDETLAAYLTRTLDLCGAACKRAGIRFDGEVIQDDFIAATAETAGRALLGAPPFNMAILNPPYRKINTLSDERRLLRLAGIETTNLYTGFLALSMRLLTPGGQMVAITPRSFCNGSYFRPFRQEFLDEMELKRLHVFESRKHAFRADDVLQENIIVYAVKRGKSRSKSTVVIETIANTGDPPRSRTVPYNRVVRPGDSQHFIHIAVDDEADGVAQRITALPATLTDLGIKVSTGRVVDFRAKEYLRQEPEKGAAPLIWPTHFDCGYIAWPKDGTHKPQAIAIDERIADQLIPNEHYVVVRRFSAKEERRRVVAAIYDPERVKSRVVGFENHLNYFHRNGRGLELELVRGLAAFLNSTMVDMYFRQFNGHTQVNATDLRNMRYPACEQLTKIGKGIGDRFPDQSGVDALVESELFDAATSFSPRLLG
ncbi:MAG: Eco57I restriction-modification methylase domain-containing protein [Isosphaeraceae bacterium]